MSIREDVELREHATAVMDAHDPSKQEGNSYERCALCSYTRHPCDTYDLAASVVALLNRLEP